MFVSRSFLICLLAMIALASPVQSQQYPYLFGEEGTAVHLDPTTFDVNPILNLTARLSDRFQWKW